MSDYGRIDPADLDNYITGHWGEDQYPDGPDFDPEPEPCWVMCTVCHKNQVNAGDGYDTCRQCEESV